MLNLEVPLKPSKLSSILVGVSWSEFLAGTLRAQPLKASPHLFLCGIPIQIFMKVFEAKERQRRYLREMPLSLV
jgi:hypothetical protein